MLNTFLKSVHTHIENHGSCAEKHQATNGNNGHEQHDGESNSDCGSECACPLHRVNGCSAITAITKNDRLIILNVSPSPISNISFLAKQSPILDGPFQPPRS
jgi:hypothetical protein